MINQIENSVMKISVNTFGAELKSIKSVIDNKEYLWQGDSKHWKGQSPLLFPIISGLKDNTYFYEGKKYNLAKHGFALNSEFEFVEEGSDFLKYRLIESEETLKSYPFKFELYVIYTIKENSLKVTYEVVNKNQNDMYFSIGGHPGFSGDVNTYVQFDEKVTSERMLFNKEIGLLSRKKGKFFDDEKRVKNEFKNFYNDTILFDDLNNKVVYVKNENLKTNIKFSFDDFKYFAIWSMPHEDTKTSSPFICVEPWLGITDYEDTNQDITKKEGIVKLERDKVFKASYLVEILDINDL